MDYSLSFPVDSFSCAEALEFIGSFAGMPLYESASGEYSFTLVSDTYDPLDARNSIRFFKNTVKKIDYFVMSLDDEQYMRLDELMASAGDHGMTFAYKADPIKAIWQSQETVNAYEAGKRPHAHLKKIDDPNGPSFLGPKIDISENPGHQRITYAMRLMAAPEMWFGPGGWAYFDKTRVSSFADAEEVRWLGPDLLYVKLFDWTVPDYEAGHILRLQERFRQWSGMDEVEAQLESMVKKG